jgi:phage tail tape-measure protein
MATGGTGGMKYQLQLSVQANTQAVDALTKSVDSLSKSLIALQNQGNKTANSLSGGLASANAQGYFLAATLERAGRQSLFFAKAFATATVGSFTTLLHEAANLEQFIIRLQATQGTTKKDALDIFNYTIKATTHLPITEAQLVRIATTFKQRGMDIRDAFGGKTYEDVIKSGHAVEGLANTMGKAGKEGVGLLDLFSDLATTQGQLATEDIGKFVREFSEFMATGQTRFLRTRLDPALLHELNNTKANSGKAMEVIYEYLAKRNAIGVSRLSMQTFSGVVTNFKGLPQRIANAVFQPGMEDGLARKFSLALSEAFETINEYFDETAEKGKRFLP